MESDDETFELTDTELDFSEDIPREGLSENTLPDNIGGGSGGEMGCGDGSQDEVEKWLKESKLECLIPRFKGK